VSAVLSFASMMVPVILKAIEGQGCIRAIYMPVELLRRPMGDEDYFREAIRRFAQLPFFFVVVDPYAMVWSGGNF